MKRFLTIAVMLMLAVSFAAAQNTLSAYTTVEEPLAKAIFDLFEAETGIKVSFVRLSGGEAIARMEAERANPQASIWFGGVGLDHITAKQKDLTLAYRSRAAATTAAEYKDVDGFWIGLYVGPLTFVTNTKRAAELGIQPPRSWADLLKPEYKGHIRVANPNTSGTAYNVVTTIRYINNGDENRTFDYLKRLDANIDQYTRSGSAPGKSVAIGEIPIAIGFAHDQVKLKVEGAPVVIHAPSEGTGYELASMSLIRGGKDAVNAKRFYDWVLTSRKAQEKFTEWFLVLVADGAPKHPEALSISQLKTVKQDLLWDGNPVNRERLLKRWTDEIGSKR